MRPIFKCRQARAAIEYAALFAIIVGAIIAIHVYMQRSFQGRFRMLGDEIGPQYQPGATSIDSTTTTHTVTNEYEMKVGESQETVPVTQSTSDVTQNSRESVEGY
jgi:Flp pilus assembly pilin Flp